MLLSIIITTRNRKNNLIECINSIKNSIGLDFERELIIVDDNSSDQTKNIDEINFGIKNIKIIHNQSQQMMVKSRNIGIKNSCGELILFVDDDNVIDQNMIKVLVDFALQKGGLLITGPSIHYYDSKEKYFVGQKINFFTGITRGIKDNSKNNIIKSDGIPNVFLITKKVFAKVGMFDERLVQTYTEPSFYFKAKRFGCECYILKNAITYHKVSKTDIFKPRMLGGEYKQKAYFLMRNRSILIFRYGEIYHKIIYTLFFSWLFPLIYSIIILYNKRFDLIKLYRLGFVDGLICSLFNKNLEINKALFKGNL